jgi:hypothetical protein
MNLSHPSSYLGSMKSGQPCNYRHTTRGFGARLDMSYRLPTAEHTRSVGASRSAEDFL